MTGNFALSITSSMRVAFYDVDSYRVVWHGAYPKYFEIARGELLEKIGYTYADMEKEQFFFPIIDMKIKYVDSLTVGQHFNITATLKEWQHKLVIDYLISDSQTGKRITKARTTQAAVKMPEKITQFESPKSLISAVKTALGDS
jgi:acyl-CoA thioester hydrolase